MTRSLDALLGAATLLVATVGAALAGPAAIQVPEPSSLALIAVGIGGVAWLKFRRRK